ncbi:uncharacterized protein H6S33_009629 [Morchella sextelata]|uniref:uncharacterized protein n=1 Tax=Morchella sextelata TaxID=1174677 RepID=UPI001D054C6D|nr:uncharacterized protein H6S33_009629 [Morchella sextelata]KAH0613249.1 hypothetical protein H6S33_009629 [Morchella sextelata]
MESEHQEKLPEEFPTNSTLDNSPALAKNSSQAPNQAPLGPSTTLETPPAKPPRPMSPQQQAQATLQEAFPSIDGAVVRAVLVASGGQIEPAFTALLSMSDPSVVEDMRPPPQPPRPRPGTHSPQRGSDYNLTQHTEHPRRQGPQGFATTPYMTSTPQNQLEADEIYARQLAEHFGAGNIGSGRGGGSSVNYNTRNVETRRRQHTPLRDEDFDPNKERSFIDDELPVIKENILKGFAETQNKFNSWITDIKKRLDGDSPENSPPPSTRNSAQYARPATGRRGSRDGGYDADPRVLTDDFTHLHLRDTTTEAPQSRRPKANPGLFEPSSADKAGRKVSFEDRPTNISDEDLYRPAPNPRPSASVSPVRQPSPATTSKWEPLKSVEPAPMDRDPFSLGDSDDEREVPSKEQETAKPVSITGPQETGITTSKVPK